MRIHALLLALALTLCSALGLSAQSVRVVYVAGSAQIQAPGEPALRPLTKGEAVTLGSRIVTGPDGRVALTPMPGVNALVTPNSDIILENASETRRADGTLDTAATIEVKQGAVVSDLLRQEGVTYDYNIRTPRGLAGARGTQYTVAVNSGGIETVLVSHSSVTLNLANGTQATLTPGQLTLTAADGTSQTITNIGQLSPADQALVQNLAETTVAALLNAVDNGATLDPEALAHALEALEALGIELPPELLALIADEDEVVEEMESESIGDDVTEVITEQQEESEPITGFASLADYAASLPLELQAAFDEVLQVGFTDTTELESRLRDGTFAAQVTQIVGYYATSEPEIKDLLIELGILGENNLAAVGADPVGFVALVDAYADIAEFEDGNLFVYRAVEADFAQGRGGPTNVELRHTFFPGNGPFAGQTIYNVRFGIPGDDSTSVGATRELRIDNTGLDGDTFVGGENEDDLYIFGQIEIRASDLVDLRATQFGPNLTDILIEARTVNLHDINFRAGSFVQVNSLLGQTNFSGSVFGKVNLSNVTYGGTLLTEQNFGDTVRGTNSDATGGNFQIGILGQRVIANDGGNGDF